MIIYNHVKRNSKKKGEKMSTKIIKDTQIVGIKLNPRYVSKEIYEDFKNKGFPVEWLNKDENNDSQELFYIVVKDEKDER